MSKMAQRRLLTVVLVAVSGLAAVKLLMEVYAASGSAGAAPAPAAVRAQTAPGVLGARAAGPAATGDTPQLRVDELKDLDSRPLPDFTRNPFDYAPTPEEIKAQQAAAEHAKAPPPPPPPPPVPFKAMGYERDLSGELTAYLSDEKSTYLVRPGQQFGQRFKVLKITNTSVEVEDESYHQIVQLPYPR